MNPQPLNRKHLSPLYINRHPDADLKHFKLGALLSFFPAYFYIVNLYQDNYFYLILSCILIILIVEMNVANFNYRELFKQKTAEDFLLISALLVQIVALAIWGTFEELVLFQMVSLHMTFLYYILSRNNSFIQGRFGSLFLIDAWRGFWIIPVKNFRFRKNILKVQLPDQHLKMKITPALVLISIGTFWVAIGVVLFAVNQLQAVSENFKLLTTNFTDLWGVFFSKIHWMDSIIDFMVYLLFSLPLGAYIYGLIFGPLIRKAGKKANYQAIQAKINRNRLLPLFSSYIVIGSLCFIYTLFLVISFLDLQSLFQVHTISPQNASHTAVSGFWQLVRVALLNFATLAVCYFFSKVAVWNKKAGKILLTILFGYTLAFALLASWKLFGIYIALYGITPLRLISGWFITVLIFWTMLTIIRIHKPFLAIRYGIFYIIITITILPYLFAMYLN
ncbi:DUF4173 domain-containing protein [Streptococcus parauberis]|uniref:DUF4173 domain-containing protein n=1 Tax=Streptococcus parauberis TaxID=1348 RepID=UPI0021566A95|nr:DUF4173 domain-containing protein [Streptococcus parauberis]